jgi:hypothetical protein
MAYNGSIKFMDIAFCEVEWVRSLRFNNKPNKHSVFDREWKSALVTDISSFRNCSVKGSESGCTILDSGGAERGELQYNVETHERLDFERCVVVGRVGNNQADLQVRRRLSKIIQVKQAKPGEE